MVSMAGRHTSKSMDNDGISLLTNTIHMCATQGKSLDKQVCVGVGGGGGGMCVSHKICVMCVFVWAAEPRQAGVCVCVCVCAHLNVLLERSCWSTCHGLGLQCACDCGGPDNASELTHVCPMPSAGVGRPGTVMPAPAAETSAHSSVDATVYAPGKHSSLGWLALPVLCGCDFSVCAPGEHT